MSPILAIDTTGEICSLALVCGDGAWTFHEPLPRQHAKQLLPALDRLFVDSGLSRTDLRFVVYGRGPGSFTGIRIAAGVAQGVALGAGCGVVPVSTLQTLAFECDPGDAGEIWVALDARMQELYFARYQKAPREIPQLLGAECLLSPADLPGPEPGITLSGNGWMTDYRFSGRWQSTLATANVAGRLPNAAQAARLATRLVERDAALVLPPEQALPVYLRDKVTWDKKPKVGS